MANILPTSVKDANSFSFFPSAIPRARQILIKPLTPATGQKREGFANPVSNDLDEREETSIDERGQMGYQE